MKSCQEHGDLQVQKEKEPWDQNGRPGQETEKWQIKYKHSPLFNRLHILKHLYSPACENVYTTPC